MLNRANHKKILVTLMMQVITALLLVFAQPAKGQQLEVDTLANKYAASLTEGDSTVHKTNLLSSVFQKEIEIPAALKNIRFGGYYRFLGYHRMMDAQYPSGALNIRRGIGSGDGYREPIMLLTVLGNPANNVYFGSNFHLYSAYRGFNANDQYNSDTLSLNLGVSLSGTIKTSAGNFSIQAGGINWYRLSPFTLWLNNQPYNRFSIFDRNPWEPASPSNSRYSTHYQEGSINQDVRWGRQAFQGIILDATELPKSINFSFIYGKTLNNGGSFGFRDTYQPSVCYGGRLLKKFGINYISLNTFNDRSSLDKLEKNTKEYNIFTTEYKWRAGGITLSGEVGVGGFRSPAYSRSWSEGLNLKFKSSNLLTFIPIELSLYQIGKSFVNINSAFINTSVDEARAKYVGNSIGSVQAYHSPMVEIGQLTNNRRGISLNTEFKIQNLKISIGNDFAGEIAKSGDRITFSHRVNGLALSRFYNFAWMPSNYGPYSNLTSVFRGVYEEVKITGVDLNGQDLNNKYFNNLEVQAKYKFKLLGRDFNAHYLGAFNSSQKKFSPVTVFNEEAYIRAYYNELEIFYSVRPKLTVVGYLGYERVLGNKETDLGENLLPRDQKTKGIGYGFDLDVAQNTGLYFRQRWFSHSDANFMYDNYKGSEATIELKIFFD